MTYFRILIPVIALLVLATSCSDKNDEPKSEQDKLVGYWALTHIKTIEQIGDNNETSDKDVPPTYLEESPNNEIPRWNVLIFTEYFVTVRGDMPSCPKFDDYDQNTPNGQIAYINDREDWLNSIGSNTDQYTCPVGTYSIKEHDLIIGLLNMGGISFVSDNEFTLDYKKVSGNGDDYKRLIYTYSRIYSL